MKVAVRARAPGNGSRSVGMSAHISAACFSLLNDGSQLLLAELSVGEPAMLNMSQNQQQQQQQHRRLQTVIHILGQVSMQPCLSVGEETPPDAMILMQWAPLRSSSRAALLTSMSPSHTAPMPLQQDSMPKVSLPPSMTFSSTVCKQVLTQPACTTCLRAAPQATQSSPFARMSPWPPVWLRACPTNSRRGPTIAPSSTA